jgi:DNA-directed RNA polymerase specialized sigma24 family protein
MDIQPKLITLCIKQDRKAEYELYQLSYNYLMSICLRYSRDKDSASESLNMGYLKILQNLKSYKPEVPFKKNKRQSEKVTYVETYFDNTNYSDVNEALSRISVKQIYEHINKLPEATKKVFNLFVIDGYSHKEIGEMLEISEGTSKWHLNAARQKLKAEIENTVLMNI